MGLCTSGAIFSGGIRFGNHAALTASIITAVGGIAYFIRTKEPTAFEGSRESLPDKLERRIAILITLSLWGPIFVGAFLYALQASRTVWMVFVSLIVFLSAILFARRQLLSRKNGHI
jgi:uncharacterized membrane protein